MAQVASTGEIYFLTTRNFTKCQFNRVSMGGKQAKTACLHDQMLLWLKSGLNMALHSAFSSFQMHTKCTMSSFPLPHSRQSVIVLVHFQGGWCRSDGNKLSRYLRNVSFIEFVYPV